MQKIKRFKITLRPAVARKNFRVLADLESVTPEHEELLTRQHERLKEFIRPAALFDTFPMERLPAYLTLKSSGGPPEPAAVSALVATIGPEIDEEVSKLSLETRDPLPGAALAALAQEAAEAAGSFILKLLAEEAKEEDCELGEPDAILDPGELEALLSEYAADRIGVHLDSQGTLSPRFTKVSRVLWLPKSSRRKRLPPSTPPEPLLDRPSS